MKNKLLIKQLRLLMWIVVAGFYIFYTTSGFSMEKRNYSVDENPCKLTLDSIMPSVTSDQITVHFIKSGMCNYPVKAQVYDNKDELLLSLDDVKSGFVIDFYLDYPKIIGGELNLVLKTGELTVSKRFVYNRPKDLVIKQYDIDTTGTVLNIIFDAEENMDLKFIIYDNESVELFSDYINTGFLLVNDEGYYVYNVDIQLYEYGMYRLGFDDGFSFISCEIIKDKQGVRKIKK
jgi:hypothetical protein